MGQQAKFEKLKNKDVITILKNIDNPWEAVAAIWICRNKEAKNVVIFLQSILILNPEWIIAMQDAALNFISGLFK